MQRLAAHQAPMNHKQCNNRMHFQSGALEPHSQRHLVEDPALGDPVGHEGVEAEGGGDGGALEVAGLARGVLGDVAARRRHVEARQPREPAQHEGGQQHVVRRRPHPEAEGHARGGQAEGDLFVFLVSRLAS